MPTEQLTYAQIAKRLSVSPEAARAIVKRHRLPRSRRNDGKTLAAIDLTEIRHKPCPRGHREVTGRLPDVVATLKARVAELETELAQAESARLVTGWTSSASASAPTNWSPPKSAWSSSWKPSTHS